VIALSSEFGQGVSRSDWIGLTSEYLDYRLNIGGGFWEVNRGRDDECRGKGYLKEENRVWLIFRAHQVAKFGASFWFNIVK